MYRSHFGLENNTEHDLSRKTVMLSVLLAVLTDFSIFTKANFVIGNLFTFRSLSCFFAIIICYIICFYKVGFPYNYINKRAKGALFISILLSVIGAFSGFFSDGYSSFYTFSFLIYIIRFAGIFVFVFTVINAFFIIADRKKYEIIVDTGSEETKLKPVVFAIFFIVILICWLPYFIKLYPCASIAWDSTTAWLLMHGLSDNTNNPFLTTVIFSSVLDLALGSGHFEIVMHLYSVIQALLYICLISYSLTWMYSKHAPKPIIIAVLILYTLVPFVPTYAYGLEKDALFGLFLLLYIQILIEFAYDSYVLIKSRPKLILFLICNLIIPGLRNGMASMLLVVSLLMLLYGILNRKGIKLLSVAALCVIIAVMNSIAIPQLAEKVYGGRDMPKESLSIPLQQIGYIIDSKGSIEDYLTDSQIEKMSQIMDVDSFESYDPLIADRIKNTFKDYPTDEEMDFFWDIWKIFIKKEPKLAAEAFVLSSSAYYTPDVFITSKDHLVLGFQNFDALDPDVEYRNSTNSDLVKNIDKKLTELPVIGLIQRIGIYMWILAALFIYSLTRREWKNIIALFPALAFLIACCLSPVNGYFRYAFPPIICTLILLPSILFVCNNGKRKIKNDSR